MPFNTRTEDDPNPRCRVRALCNLAVILSPIVTNGPAGVRYDFKPGDEFDAQLLDLRGMREGEHYAFIAAAPEPPPAPPVPTDPNPLRRARALESLAVMTREHGMGVPTRHEIKGGDVFEAQLYDLKGLTEGVHYEFIDD